MMFVFGNTGCQEKQDNGIAKMHWDRDMCDRCQMAISERKFAVQIIDPLSHRVYKFDDIGCAVLWLDEEKIPWRDKAIIWITDAKTGKWLDAKKANYISGAITPMAFGFAAYSNETLPKNKTIFMYSSIVKKIEKIKSDNMHKVKEN